MGAVRGAEAEDHQQADHGMPRGCCGPIVPCRIPIANPNASLRAFSRRPAGTNRSITCAMAIAIANEARASSRAVLRTGAGLWGIGLSTRGELAPLAAVQ